MEAQDLKNIICGVGLKYESRAYPGVSVSTVHEDTPAYKAGMRDGDVLLQKREPGGDWRPVNSFRSFKTLGGAVGSAIELRYRDTNGDIREHTLVRSPYTGTARDIFPHELPEQCGAVLSHAEEPASGLPPHLNRAGAGVNGQERQRG